MVPSALNATFLSAVFALFLAAELYVLVRARTNILLFLAFVASLIVWFLYVAAANTPGRQITDAMVARLPW